MSKPDANGEPKLNRRKAFQAAASDLGATFAAGRLSLDDSVLLEHGPWRVILDTYVVNHGQNPITYTRVRASYVAKEDFTLRISPRNVFTPIAELLGFHGLPSGDREFKRKYTIKASNETRGRSLMTDRRLRELILRQPSLRLEIRRLPWSKRKKTGDGIRMVTVGIVGVVKEPDRLVDYVLLVAATLDGLLRIGAAYSEPVTADRNYAPPQRI